MRGRALLAGLRLETLTAADLIDVGLALMEDAVIDEEISKARSQVFAAIANLPADAAQQRAEAARDRTETILTPMPGLDEGPMGVI